MTRTPAALFALAGIGVIIATILIGPFFSPPEFHWVEHTTSQQGGQQVAGAWIMRAGFYAYGIGTVIAAVLDRGGRLFVRLALLVFGLGMVGAAIWAHAPILPDVPADLREDWLHSVASSVVGAGFALACTARLFAPGGNARDPLAWTGLVVSVAVPLAMTGFPEIGGLLQRVMFAISFVFVGREFAGPGRATV